MHSTQRTIDHMMSISDNMMGKGIRQDKKTKEYYHVGYNRGTFDKKKELEKYATDYASITEDIKNHPKYIIELQKDLDNILDYAIILLKKKTNIDEFDNINEELLNIYPNQDDESEDAKNMRLLLNGVLHRLYADIPKLTDEQMYNLLEEKNKGNETELSKHTYDIKEFPQPDNAIPTRFINIDNKEDTTFADNEAFEMDVTGVDNNIYYTNPQGDSLQGRKYYYMRAVIQSLLPDLWDRIKDKTGKTYVISFNTNNNVYLSGKKIWISDPNYWIDGLWILSWKENNEWVKEKIAVEYKYYTNYKEVDYAFKEQYDYMLSVKEQIEQDIGDETHKTRLLRKLFSINEKLGVLLSGTKFGINKKNLTEADKIYKSILFNMLGKVKQTPIINDVGVITGVDNVIESKKEQDLLFNGARIVFVVAMSDYLIGMNYSYAIDTKQVSLTNPIRHTIDELPTDLKLAGSAYKKNEKVVKSLKINPLQFKYITKDIHSKSRKGQSESKKTPIENKFRDMLLTGKGL